MGTCITPHLSVKDAARAIEFYVEAFGAKEEYRLTEPNGRIGHAEIRIGDARFYLADEYPELGIRGPQSPGGGGVSLTLLVDDVDAIVRRAVSAGSDLQRPVKDEFYGERTGTIHDPFGHRWHISTTIEQVEPEEMQRRFDELLASGT